MLQNVLTITIGHSLPLVALIRSVSDFKSLNFEYIAIQRQMDLPHSLLDKLFALENILVSLVSELRGCLTHFPYYVCRDSSSYNIIIIFIGFYCANINPGKEIFICAFYSIKMFDRSNSISLGRVRLSESHRHDNEQLGGAFRRHQKSALA